MFEKANKCKLRFNTTKGQLTVEDLYDLSLQSLDAIAVNVNKQLKEEATESFLDTAKNADASNALRLEILKHIMREKQDDAILRKQRSVRAQELAQLKEILASKKSQELLSLSAEELEKRIALLSE